MNVFDKPVTVSENDICLFQTTSWTKGITDYAKSREVEVYCLLAVQKKNENDKDYILIDKDSNVIYSSKNSEEVAVQIDILAMNKEKK